MAANMARRGGHHSWSHGSNLNEVDGGLHGTADIESGQGYGSSGRTVSEGEVLIHFLALYSTPNVGFQSSSQGIGKHCCRTHRYLNAAYNNLMSIFHTDPLPSTTYSSKSH